MMNSFIGSRAGNVAMMFGLLLIPLLLGAGVGIDTMRINTARSKLAEAADSGLLAAIRSRTLDGALTDAEAEAIARRYFNANAASGSNIEISSFSFVQVPGEDRFRLTVTGRIKTTIMAVAGRRWVPINLVSEATMAAPRSLEVALVLDNTYSMTGAKLTALKNAATELVDTVMADTDNQVKVSLVPFSQYVNVGLSRRAAVWLDVDDDYSVTTPNVCRTTYPERTSSNCVTVPRTCHRDGVPYDCSYQDCDVDDGDPVEVCEDQTQNYTWHGCVGSRDNPLNVEDRSYGTDLVPGLLNIWCAREFTPLTTDKAAVLSEITAMSVQGGQTYIPAGLMWGYRALSNIAPLTEGITYADMTANDAVKAIVLMTDGENTKSASYPKHTASGGSGADAILEGVCDEAKGDSITIYTIAFAVTDSDTRDLLESCATAPGNYYNATDSTALFDAFEAIGLSLTELALTK